MTNDFLTHYLTFNTATFQTFSDGVILLDAAGKIIYHNDAVKEILPCKPGTQLLHGSLVDCFVKDEEGVRALLSDSLQGAFSEYEASCPVEGKRDMTIHLKTGPIHNGTGKCCGTVLLVRDTSTLNALRRRNRWLKKIPANNPDLIFQTTIDGTIKYYNPAVKDFITKGKFPFKEGLNLFREIFKNQFSASPIEENREKSEFEAEVKGKVLHFSYAAFKSDNEVFISCKDVTHYVALEMENMAYSSHLEEIVHDEVKKVEETQLAAIIGIAKLAETRDVATGKHLDRVREYSRVIAEALRKNEKFTLSLTSKVVEMITVASVLHDIGKVGIPDEILLKPGKFTKEEFDVMTEHSIIGGEAIEEMEKLLKERGGEGQNLLKFGREIAYYHHEKYDGTGYPFGKKGNEIPLCARIVSLADVFDALTSRRVYKDAFPFELALKIINEGKGIQFDPDVVDAFHSRLEEVKQLAHELAD